MSVRARIVCATDLRVRSNFALHRAVRLAQQIGARLTLVHAVDARRSGPRVSAQVNRAYVHLLSKVEEAFGSASAAIDVVVRAGSPLDIIVKVATEADAELLVLAAPQRQRLDALFGGTAERLLRVLKRPILVVHRRTTFSYRRVAMAVDLSNAALPVIQEATRLGMLERAETTLLHAQNHAWQGDAQLRLQAILTAAEMAVDRTRILVRTEQPADAIGQLIEEERTDLLTIGASRWLLVKRLLVARMAQSMLRVPMCDILVIPQRIAPRRAVGPVDPRPRAA